MKILSLAVAEEYSILRAFFTCNFGSPNFINAAMGSSHVSYFDQFVDGMP